MLNKIKGKKVTWVDIKNPDAKEIAKLQKEHKIHPLIAQELIKTTFRSKIDAYHNMFYVVLHFPIYDAEKRTSTSREIDFIIGKNFLISVRYEDIKGFSELSESCNENSALCKQLLDQHPGYLFYAIISRLYENTLNDLDRIQKKIDLIEDKIFQGREKEMVPILSLTTREVLDIRRILKPQESVLQSLERADSKFFGKTFELYISDIMGEYARAWNLLENHKETIEALNTTNESLLSTKTNEVMKILTIMAFVTFPLMLFSSLFGMNTKTLPIVGTPGDFWIIIGIMVIATTIFFGFFKWKKWI